MPEKPKLPRGCYWRGETIWARFKIKGVTYRESLRTRVVADAERRMKAVKKQIEEQVYYGGLEVISWPQAVVAWDGWIKRQHKRAGTIKRYLVSIVQLRPWLDIMDVQRIDMETVRKIVRDRSKLGVSNATIRRDLTAMSSVLDAAIFEGWIKENPAHSYDRRMLQEKRDPIELPTEDSIAAVLALGSRFVEMAAFSRMSGMREEEIASLRHDQIDRSRMAINVQHTKTGLPRQVPITADMLELIERQPPFLRCPFVFWRGAGERFKNVGSQFHATVMRVAQKRARAGLPFKRFRFHDLRHLYAVETLRSRRASIYELQQLLGHTSVKTTEIYLCHLTHDEQQAAKQGVAQISPQDERFESEKAGKNG